MVQSRRVLASCPRTGIWLDTGLVVRGDTFERLERLESSVFCPACAQLHRWTRETIVLEGEAPKRREDTTNTPL